MFKHTAHIYAKPCIEQNQSFLKNTLMMFYYLVSVSLTTVEGLFMQHTACQSITYTRIKIAARVNATASSTGRVSMRLHALVVRKRRRMYITEYKY